MTKEERETQELNILLWLEIDRKRDEIERLESDMSAMIQRHAAEVKTLESMLAESRKNGATYLIHKRGFEKWRKEIEMTPLEIVRNALDMLDLSQALLERSIHHKEILAAYKNLRTAIEEIDGRRNRMMDFCIDDGILRWDDGSCRPATETEKLMKAEIERLESDMSAMIQRHAAEVKGIESMLAESRKNDLYSMRLLAESHAREAKLREVLAQCKEYPARPEYIYQVTKTALAIPHDDTALKEVCELAVKDAIRERLAAQGITVFV